MTSPRDLILRYRDIFAAHRIELIDLMGAGGEAPVFLAWRTLLDGLSVRDCAVKIYEFEDVQPELPPEIRQQLSAMESLQNQPHIVQLYEVIPHCQFVALVLELGIESLQDVLDRNRTGVGFSRPVCLEWFEPIARALDVMHAANHYHLDVKPSNVLFCNGGQIKLCDFGTVTFADSRTTVVQPKAATPAYLLPGYEKRPPKERDQFALAVSYVYARTGRLPFGNEGPLYRKYDGEGLEPDERDVWLPILKCELPVVTCLQLMTRLRSVSVKAGPSFSERAGILVDRVESRRWKDGYQPDERDIEDLHHAKSLLDEHAAAATDSDQFQALRSRVLATLADLTESEKLFTEALEEISKAISLAPDSADHLAYRADLRLIAGFGGTRNLPLMFILGPQVFDAPNSPWSSDVDTWNATALAESLSDITKAVALAPTPTGLARQAQLLVLRGIVLYQKGEFPGAEQLEIWNGGAVNKPDCDWVVNQEGVVSSTESWWPSQRTTSFYSLTNISGENLHEDAFPILFSEPIRVLNRAIELSQSPLVTANLLLQRAWTHAGFNFSDSWSPYPIDRSVWSITEAIADLGRAQRSVREHWAKHEDDNSEYSDVDKYAIELGMVIHRRQRSYSLSLALEIDDGARDLLGMLNFASYQYTIYFEDQKTLAQLLDGFKFGREGIVSAYGSRIEEYLADPERSHLVSAAKLAKFFAFHRKG